MESMKCPKCSENLEEGFVADNNLASVLPSIWVAGSPESSFWTGKFGAKVSDKIKRQIQTYRCVGCGYLESFATTEWPGK